MIQRRDIFLTVLVDVASIRRLQYLRYYGAVVTCQALSIRAGEFILLGVFLTADRWFPILFVYKNINPV